MSKPSFGCGRNNGARFVEEMPYSVTHGAKMVCDVDEKVSRMSLLHSYLSKIELLEKDSEAFKIIRLTHIYLIINRELILDVIPKMYCNTKN